MAGRQQQGIQSLETGVRLFQALHSLSRPAALSELAKLSRMPAAKVHRYCVSLIRTGLMQQDKRGLYGVGPYGFQISSTRADLELARKLAAAALPALVNKINETAFVSGWGQNGPVILDVEEPRKPLLIRPNWKGDLPLCNSATGRAFAAYLTPERLEKLMASEFAILSRAEKLSATQLAARKREFARHLADVRKHGVARTTGERYAGVVSFAVPIFDHGGDVTLALTSFGMAATYSSAWDGTVPKALKACAAELTERIGGSKP